MRTYFMTNLPIKAGWFPVKFTDELGSIIYTAESNTSYEAAKAHGKAQIRTQSAFNSLFGAIVEGKPREEIKFLEIESEVTA